jgi:outer membrane protein OmpA-like peptidoglycan-associated protein
MQDFVTKPRGPAAERPLGGQQVMRYATLRRWAATGALLSAVVAVSGCSWVRNVTGWGEEEANRPRPPGVQQPYPNLATVPNKTPNTGSTRERLQIEEGLLADRQNARHVSGPVAGLDRPSSLPPDPGVRTTIIDPRARPQPGTRTAAAQPQAPQAPRLGPGGAVGSIAYGPGSASLPEGSGRVIVRAAEFQRRLGGTIVVVGSAARSEGDDAARRALAQQRAGNVANGLLNLGVPRDRIRAGAGGADAGRVDIAIQPAR